MSHRQITACSLALLAAVGCGGNLFDPPTGGRSNPNGNCASFVIVSKETFQPSVVRIAFQLSSCNGAPLPGKLSEDFLITEDGTDVSMFESDQELVTDVRCFQLITVLLLDMSGSIRRSGNLPSLQQGATAFVETVSQDQTIAVYTFDGRERMQLLTNFTNDVNLLKAGIASLTDYTVVDRSTNLNGAIIDGLTILEAGLTSLGPDGLKDGSLVVFTDGTDQATRRSDDDAIAKVQGSSHRVYTIGLGGEIDVNTLDLIGKDGLFFAPDEETLEQEFENAATAIRNAAQSNYILAYCSPKRAGTHILELSLREYHGTATYEFPSDGFLGGCTSTDYIGKIGCGSDCLVGGDCDDGNLCNGQETCFHDRCVPGEFLVCDDGDSCTVDTCDPSAGCVTSVISGCCLSSLACDDADPCTADLCAGLQCTHSSIPGCSDTLTLDLGSDVFMDLIRIPAGTFVMGSNEITDEQPLHSVTLTQDFYLGEFEVTQAQWKAVMGSNPSIFTGDELPVDSVSWDDVAQFMQASGFDLRLPTEAEWEYAVRAGTPSAYHFGDSQTPLVDYAWYTVNSGDRTHQVGQKFPNPLGLYDMYGNVWEWCSDWYANNYYDLSPETNPDGPGSGTLRVLRGSAYNFSANFLRSANRNLSLPNERRSDVGFRIALTP